MTNPDELPVTDCCGPNAEADANCDCTPPKKSTTRLKAMIFAGVMLLALSVGAYSFWLKPAAPACSSGQNCGAGGSCCSSATK
jgi:hypothetical protein